MVDKVMSTKKNKNVIKNIHDVCEFRYKQLTEDFEGAKKYTDNLITSYRKASKEGSERIDDLNQELEIKQNRISALEMSLVFAESAVKMYRQRLNFLERNPDRLSLAVGDKQSAMRKDINTK